MYQNAASIAEQVGGTVEGDPSVIIHRVGSLDKAEPGAIAFYYDPKYLPHLFATRASAVFVNKDFVANQPLSTTLIRVDHPYRAFNTILNHFYQESLPIPSIEFPHFIAADAVIGDDVYIGFNAYIGKGVTIGKGAKIFPHCFIGENSIIGENTILYPQVTVYPKCKIGSRCIIHAGAVIGSDGFGFLKDEKGNNLKIPQLGGVILEDEVEIGANTTIDRATLDETMIRKGVKLDNLVQVAHNTEIGEQTVIASQTGLAGGVKIGKNCMIAGQVGFVGHIQIADQTQIGGQSGISKSITEKGKVLRGAPATDIKTQLRSEALFRRLPELLERIETLEKLLHQQENPQS